MIWQILLLGLGFVLLINGSNIFIDGSSSIAKRLKLSKLLIGITIVAFGTSLPELAISIKAIISGNGDIALGTVIGSNIINVLLVLGLCSIIRPLRVKNSTVKRELPITLLVSCLFIVLLSDAIFDTSKIAKITRSDGLVILLFFSIFIYYLISMMRKKIDNVEDTEKPKLSLCKSIIFVVLGLAGLIVGSELIVNCSVNIAEELEISQRIISLTIISIGTALPELAIAIVAALKDEDDILIGNVVGSNIINICIVLGLPILLLGGIVPSSFKSMDLIMLAISSLILYIFAKTDSTIKRNEGIFMILCFIFYYVYLFVI